jgi:hypothetical protein
MLWRYWIRSMISWARGVVDILVRFVGVIEGRPRSPSVICYISARRTGSKIWSIVL